MSSNAFDTAVAPNPAAVSWINPRLTPGERRGDLTGIPGIPAWRFHPPGAIGQDGIRALSPR